MGGCWNGREAASPSLSVAPFYAQTISAGDSHSLALSRRGQLLSWGMANYGRLGFSEGVLRLPRESDGTAYQPLPRQIWAGAVLSSTWAGADVGIQQWRPADVDSGTVTGGGESAGLDRRESLADMSRV